MVRFAGPGSGRMRDRLRRRVFPAAHPFAAAQHRSFPRCRHPHPFHPSSPSANDGTDGRRAGASGSLTEARSGTNIVLSYEGKSAAEIGKAADEVCFRRAHARYPYWAKTPRMTTKEVSNFTRQHGSFQRAHALPAQRGDAAILLGKRAPHDQAETAMYFRGIDHGNRIARRDLDEALDPGCTPSGCTSRVQRDSFRRPPTSQRN